MLFSVHSCYCSLPSILFLFIWNTRVAKSIITNFLVVTQTLVCYLFKHVFTWLFNFLDAVTFSLLLQITTTLQSQLHYNWCKWTIFQIFQASKSNRKVFTCCTVFAPFLRWALTFNVYRSWCNFVICTQSKSVAELKCKCKTLCQTVQVDMPITMTETFLNVWALLSLTVVRNS